MTNYSPRNNVINSINRRRYIDKLKGNIGAIKENNRTPIHYKLIDKYENITSNVPIKHIAIFFSIFILFCVVFYYFKPSFILKKQIQESTLKISSKSNKQNEKVVSYWKLLFYSLIISTVLFSILYFLRNKNSYIGKLFESQNN